MNAFLRYFLLLFICIFFLSPSYSQDLKEFQRLYEIAKNNNDNNQMIYYLNKIAIRNWENKKPDDAVSYFLQSIDYNKKAGNMRGIMTTYTQIGNIYLEENRLTDALTYYKKSLEVRRSLKKKIDIAYGLLAIGEVYENMQNNRDAVIALEEAEALAQEISDNYLFMKVYGFLYPNYQAVGATEKSQKAYEKFTVYRTKVKDAELKRAEEETKLQMEKIKEVAQKEVSEKEMELNNESQKLKLVKDSMSEIEAISKEKSKEIDNLSRDREMQNLLIKEREAQLRNTRLIRNFILAFLAFLLLIVFYIFKEFRNKQRINAKLEIKNYEIQKRNQEIAIQRDNITSKSQELQFALEQINTQNVNITNSLNYAQRIQRAMLPTEDSLREFLPESFILFKPRNIVSGDFYFFKKVDSMAKITKFLLHNQDDQVDFEDPNLQSKTFLIAAVDCTGHGVPGAFMSMIGFNLLNEITNKGVKRCNTVLNLLHKSVRNALRQESTENRDGMDMALCIYDDEEDILQFSGAKNPLVYIQNNEFFRINGDKESIGGIQREDRRKFTNSSIHINVPTTCYIYSDGYADQFGGPKGRKFMKEKFHNLLFSVHDKPLEEQKMILNTTLEEWKGSEYQQVDDILIIGFRLHPSKKNENTNNNEIVSDKTTDPALEE